VRRIVNIEAAKEANGIEFLTGIMLKIHREWRVDNGIYTGDWMWSKSFIIT
jgi:hypothetical protein